MLIETQQQFDNVMNDPLTTLSTVIEFPGGSVDWKLNITKPCTIFGNNTTIDVSSLGYDVAVTISAGIDISDITVLNSEKTAILLNSVQEGKFEKIRAGHSLYGWIIQDSMNNEFNECEAYNCGTGIELVGSSNIIGDIDSYQELGLSGLTNNIESGILPGKDYYFKISGHEYMFTAIETTINHLIYYLNNAKRLSDNQVLKADYLVTLTNGDIRISSLTNSSVLIERGVSGPDLFRYINGFDTKEQTHITFNESNLSLQNKYFFFNTFDNQYYIWYNVANGGFDPLNDITKTSLVVDLNDNDNAEQVTTKTKHVINTIISIIEEINVEQNVDTLIITAIPGGNHTNIQDGNTGFSFSVIDGALDGVFEPVNNQILEEERTDRCHHNIWFDSLIHDNTIGIKLFNANHNEFTNCQVYQNTNIGLWQTDVSHNNIFRGEIYENLKYGVRNTDKNHVLDVSQTWWGDMTGPKGAGRGEGDKASNYVIFEPWLQSGTEPELTYPATRQWIWHMLGYPQVAVELTEEQVSESITLALDKFHYYWQPEPYYHYLSLGGSRHEIELPATIRKEQIIEVNYSPQADIFSQLSGSGESFFLTYYLQKSGGTFLSDFYIAMAYKETFERTLGLVPSYEFITHPDENGTMKDYIRLYPSPSGNSIKVGLKVSRELSEQEVDNNMWIRKYALTWAKEMLGQIRSKFGSVPGPTGEVTLKGSELISEALQAREALILDLIKRGEPLGFTTG